MKLFRKAWLAGAYYLSWILFGLGAVGLILLFAPLFWMRDRQSLRGHARGCSILLIRLWILWFRASGVISITWRGFECLPKTGTVFVANHPSLLDAPLILSQIPDSFCIFKPALLKNVFVGPMALLLGHVSGDLGVDTIRHAARRITRGESLLIFPEGTRTPADGILNPFKPGFALIAQMAGAPVRIIRVRSSGDFGCKNRAWWKLPTLPARLDFSLEESITVDEKSTTANLIESLEIKLGNIPPLLFEATKS